MLAAPSAGGWFLRGQVRWLYWRGSLSLFELNDFLWVTICLGSVVLLGGIVCVCVLS